MLFFFCSFNDEKSVSFGYFLQFVVDDKDEKSVSSIRLFTLSIIQLMLIELKNKNWTNNKLRTISLLRISAMIFMWMLVRFTWKRLLIRFRLFVRTQKHRKISI